MPRLNDDPFPGIEPVLNDATLRPMAQSAAPSTATPLTAAPSPVQPAAQPVIAQPPRPESAQQPQRYVPVLSEVIGLSATSATAANVAATPAAPESSEDPATQEKRVHAAVQAVLRGLGPEFDQRLAEAMSRVLHEQLQGLHAKVRQAVAREVRAAVVAALTDDADAPADEATPGGVV